MSPTPAPVVDPGAARPAEGVRAHPTRSVRHQVAVGIAGLVVLLAVLTASGGLGAPAWAIALACAGALALAVLGAAARSGRDTLGPADVVTLTRALLGCAAAALTAEVLLGHRATPALLAVVVPALVLDAVDGRVARRTGTASPFGGRFDGEVDAFVILVLSVAVVPVVGWWAIAAGAARYAFGAAGRGQSWLRGERLEFRYWRKVVTATVGILLTVALAGVLSPWGSRAAVVGALLLLAESFGRDVWWLWRRRHGTARPERSTVARPRASDEVAGPAPGGVRRAARVTGGVAAGLVTVALGWFALMAPMRPDLVTPAAFLRLPVEAVLVAAALTMLPRREARVLAWLVAVALTGLVLLKVADLAMFAVLDRRVDLLADRGQVTAGLAFVRDSFGWWAAAGSVAAGALVVCGVLACLAWGAHRTVMAGARHRAGARRAVAVAGAVWVLVAVSGLQTATGRSLAAHDAGPFVLDTVGATAAGYRARQGFDRQVAHDPFASAARRDLAGLHGKDVLLVFVESYGRVAVEGPGSQGVQRLLDTGDTHLSSLGWSARSAYLTSPTFGSNSWLAHSTFQSGLPVSDQSRYDRLLSARRTTLSSAFADAGWRTVAVLPSTHGRWPEGQAFYGFDEVYGRGDLGYAGPAFGFSAMPDQFALSALGRRELNPPHRPAVMAEVELTSSHGPWAPLPTMVPPDALGDGSAFERIHADAVSAAALWSDRSAVPAAYRASISYSLTSLLSFVEQHARDDLVLIVLGDHQPSTIVSGFGGNRDVPITVLARDPAVTARMADWGWQVGLRPAAGSPVWPMDAFRDRFLTTFSGTSPVVPVGSP